MTKSALAVEQPLLWDGRSALHWGFAVPESVMKRSGLPVNGAVERIEFGRAFVYHFSDLENAFSMEDAATHRHPAFDVIRELGFRPAGTGLLINEMRLTDDSGASNSGVGRFIIPVAR